MATITAPSRKPIKKQLVLAACGAALVLAVAGVGSWQAVERSGGAGPRAATPQEVSSTTSVQPAEDAAVSDQEMYQQWQQERSRAAGAAGSATSAAPQTIYLVGSQQQADAARDLLDQANGARAFAGEPLLTDEIVVVTSEAQAARLRADVADYEAVRLGTVGITGMAGPPLQVVDLRSP